MTETTRPQKILEQVYILINRGEYAKALELIDKIEEQNQFNEIHTACPLIDIGSGLKNPELIMKGVGIFEKWLPKINDKRSQASFYYNLANGFMAMWEITRVREKSDIKLLPGNKDLQEAKRYLRCAINLLTYMDEASKLKVLTNFGNCLDNLGRGMEALKVYDEALKINPNFCMALGNKAITIKRFAAIAGAYQGATYIEAYQILKAIIENPEIVNAGTIAAKRAFENEIAKIKDIINDEALLNKNLKHRKYSENGLSDFEKFYLDFCSTNRLFLNLHILDYNCDAAIIDPVFIKMDMKEPFFMLAKTINQIKEDYMVARLLLVQSLHKTCDFDNISRRTTLVNTEDNAMFHIYSGILKSAYRISFNILDKIAFFIRDYLSLDMEDDEIYFHTIWKSKEGDITKEILETENISLFALYDVYLDFCNEPNYKKLRKIRNSLVHRNLVIYDSKKTKLYDENPDDCNIGWDTMLNKTIDVMFLMKCAVIYLINFVELEERKKRAKYQGVEIKKVSPKTTQML